MLPCVCVCVRRGYFTIWTVPFKCFWIVIRILTKRLLEVCGRRSPSPSSLLCLFHISLSSFSTLYFFIMLFYCASLLFSNLHFFVAWFLWPSIFSLFTIRFFSLFFFFVILCLYLLLPTHFVSHQEHFQKRTHRQTIKIHTTTCFQFNEERTVFGFVLIRYHTQQMELDWKQQQQL